jgi:phosphate transport system permease protein
MTTKEPVTTLPHGRAVRDEPKIEVPAEINVGDRVFRYVTGGVAVLVLVLLMTMGVQMTRASLPTLSRFGARFIASQAWDPLHDQYGALPYIFGTIATSLLALIIAVPLSLGVAISLSELVPGWLRAPLGFVVELLAAIPSVVYGLWGIFVMVPWVRETIEPLLANTFGFLPLFQGIPNGYGMLAGGVILAIMIVPTITAVSRDVLSAVPLGQREAALALGATRWETIRVAVLPYARSGIVGSAILGLGRALGETMAVTMVIGNRPQISASVFSPAATLASVIANEYAEATSDVHLSALSELGLILFGVAVLLNVLARLLVWKVATPAPGIVDL